MVPLPQHVAYLQPATSPHHGPKGPKARTKAHTTLIHQYTTTHSPLGHSLPLPPNSNPRRRAALQAPRQREAARGTPAWAHGGVGRRLRGAQLLPPEWGAQATPLAASGELTLGADAKRHGGGRRRRGQRGVQPCRGGGIGEAPAGSAAGCGLWRGGEVGGRRQWPEAEILVRFV